MADKRLNKDQVAPANVLDNIGDSATKNEKKVESLTRAMKELKNVAKTIKGGLAGAKATDTKSIQELNDLTRKANITAQTKLGIDKELLIQKEKLRAANAAQNKSIKEELALAKSQKGSLERVRLESKKLRNEKEKLDLTSKKGNQRLKIINRTLDRNNAILDKNATKLGKQKNAIGKYSNALRGLRSGLAALGVSMGVFALIRDSFNIIKDFQQAQANLASVLGVNVNQMKQLTDQAKELGATTRFTASQVSELQVELAKLGFTQQQINEMTPATLALAEATGSELAEAASVAGGTMNALGLEAKDMQRIVDVMAKSFSSSALDMEKFKETMKNAAPIARATGVSLEVATAAAGKLADANISGSKAGTDLKKIFSELVKDGKPFQESLSDIAAQMAGASTKAEKLAIAEKIVGDRAKGALLVLTEQKEGLGELAVELENADGAAAKMADTQRNTLGGALDLLRSAWEGFILSMDEAGGVGETLRAGIKFLADNLVTILKVLGKVIKVFVIYKATLAALKLRDKIKDQIDYNRSLKKGGKDAKAATTGVKAFGAALKGIGLSLAIALVLELATAWLKVASGAQQAAKFAKAYRDAEKFGGDKSQERVDNINKTLKDQVTALKLLETKNLKAAKTEKERQGIRAKTIKDIEALTVAKEKSLKATVKQFREEKNAALAAQKIAVKARDNFIKAHGGRTSILIKEKNLTGTIKKLGKEGFGVGEGDAESKRLRELDKEVVRIGRTIARTSGALVVYKNELSATTDDVIRFKIEEGSNLKVLDSKTKSIKKLNTVLEEQNEILSRQLELLQELDQLEFNARVRDVQSQIDEELANAAKGARETAELDVDFIEQLVAKKNDILREAALERQEFEIATIIEQNRIESEEALSSLIAKRDELLAQEGITAAQILDINTQYQEQLKQLEMNELQRAADLELEIRGIKGRTSEELIEIKNAENDELDSINDELIAAQIEGANKLSEEKKKEFEEEKKRQEELRDMIEKFGNEVLDGLISRSKKKQSLLDAEISKEQELLDTLREGAKDQNAIATESIAAAEASIEAKERQKIKEAENEARLEEIKAIWNALNNFLDQGDSLPEATIKATTGVFGVRKLIESIPGFLSGTKGRMKDERKADMTGKDGHIIRIDDDEAILNSGNMDKAEAYGMNTTDDIVNDAVKFHQMQAIQTSNYAHNNSNNNNNSELISEIKDLKKVIKDKPETSFSQHIIQGWADGVVRLEKRGSVTNKYITHGK